MQMCYLKISILCSCDSPPHSSSLGSLDTIQGCPHDYATGDQGNPKQNHLLLYGLIPLCVRENADIHFTLLTQLVGEKNKGDLR